MFGRIQHRVLDLDATGGDVRVESLEPEVVGQFFNEQHQRVDLFRVALGKLLLDGDVDRGVVLVANAVERQVFDFARNNSDTQFLHVLEVEVGNIKSLRRETLLAEVAGVDFSYDAV